MRRWWAAGGRTGAALASAAALQACAPAHDWREIKPPGTQLQVLMPCKPHGQARSITLAGVAVRFALQVCNAGGQTWALGWAEMGDPAKVGEALQELRSSARSNLEAASEQAVALAVAGATPNAQAARLRLQGAKPGGEAMVGETAVFAHGTQVFQATVLGASVPIEVADVFFRSLRLDPAGRTSR